MTATVPNLFGSGTSGTTPQLDADFAALAKCLVIPCTATGTNVVALTPVSSSVTVSAYSDKEIYSFTAANTTTGAVTANVQGVGALNVYLSDQTTQATTGTLAAGSFYMIAYLASLNSGSGGFVIINGPTTTTTTVATKGTFSNLKIANGSSADTQLQITCDSIMLATAGNTYVPANAVNVTLSINSIGANGLDSGSPVSNTFYYPYVIYNGTTVASLLSRSSGAPSLPTGYTYFSRVGAVLMDSASKLYRGRQNNTKFQFTITSGTTTSAFLSLASGAAGSVTIPTWAPVSISSAVPSTASGILLTGTSLNSSERIIMAPNPSYGGYGSLGAPPYFLIPFAAAGQNAGGFVSMELESRLIYWANAGGSTDILLCAGWEDNL